MLRKTLSVEMTSNCFQITFARTAQIIDRENNYLTLIMLIVLCYISSQSQYYIAMIKRNISHFALVSRCDITTVDIRHILGRHIERRQKCRKRRKL